MNINNYGNYSAKSTSLKALQFNLRKPNISDLPFEHYKPVNTEANVRKVTKYCIKDVDDTEQIFDLSKNLLSYRIKYGKLQKLDILSDSEVQLAKKVVSKIISPLLEIEEKDFKYYGTYRDQIVVKDTIKPIKFELEENKKLLEYYQSVILKASLKSKLHKDKKTISLKNSISYSITYSNGLKNDYGSGGLHGVVPSNIYKTNDKYILVDYDFGSYYPHLINNFEIEPKHLPKKLLGKLLMTWYQERKEKYPKKDNWDLNYAIKIIINLIYGLTKSEYFGLYDPQCTLGVCVNGMLQLTKMIEICMLNKGEVIYVNTDGFILKCKPENYSIINELLFDYADSIKIPLESIKLKSLFLGDVNNYIVVDEYSNVKEKGKFERYETIISHKDYHKNTSAMIIPEALHQYFINGISVKDTIENHNNIYDFCYGVKGGSQFDLIESGDNISDTVIVENIIQDMENPGQATYQFVEQLKTTDNLITSNIYNVRMLRYYISNNGSTLSKLWKENSKSGVSFKSVQANNTVTVLQNIKNKEIDNYKDLNKQYYIDKTIEIIDKIENTLVIN